MSGGATYIANARLIDPASGRDERGGLLAVDGRIVALGPDAASQGVPHGAVHIDAGGACLAPGLVDIRVRLGEPGEEHKETIATGAAAAAAGGVTALAALPDTEPPVDSVAGIEFIARRARDVKAGKVFAYACVTQGGQGTHMAELGLLAEAGAVAFTDGRTAVADPVMMSRALKYAGALGRPIVQHPEEPRLAGGGSMNAGELATRLGLTGVPPEAEVIMVERDLRLVEATGARYHVAHVSTAAAVAAIRRAKARGLPVTCDTAPAYFTLTETDVGDYRTFAKVSPPLRSEMDRRAIVEAIADGTIDILASDHTPQDVDSKRQPFRLAEPGIVGLETLLPLSLGLVHGGHVTLIDLLARLTAAPAALIGQDVGQMAVGTPADLVLFDPDRPGKIDVEAFRSKSKNAPYDGRPISGRVLRTLVDGRTVFQHDK